MPFEYGPQLAHSKAGCEQFVLPQFRFQIIGCDLSSLRCTWQWAGYNQIRSHLEACEKFRHVAHFFFTKIGQRALDRKSTRLNSSHQIISYAVFCLKKKK